MFQIGFPELLTLLVLTLLLVGPKRLPEVTKFFIQIWSKLRSQYEKISNEINNEIGTEEIKKDIFNDMKLQELELEESEDPRSSSADEFVYLEPYPAFSIVVSAGP